VTLATNLRKHQSVTGNILDIATETPEYQSMGGMGCSEQGLMIISS